MIRLVREFRLLPVVLLAAALLLVLKSAGLLLEGGYIFGPDEQDAALSTDQPPPEAADPIVVGSIKQSPEAAATAPLPRVSVQTPAAAAAENKQSWAQQMFNFPDVTGSVGATETKVAAEAPKAHAKPAPKAPPKVKEASVPIDMSLDHNAHSVSPSERAILERLQDRRKQIEARARELDMRENLIKAAEKRLEGKVNELKTIEGRIHAVKVQKQESDAARLKDLVTMYENMKAKDAARIFDRLNMKVLVEVASKINPRRMADILAQMSPETAERLTIEFASRANGDASPLPAELPKIQGKPNRS